MGMKTLRKLNEVKTLNERPVKDCKITKCGELSPAEFAALATKSKKESVPHLSP